MATPPKPPMIKAGNGHRCIICSSPNAARIAKELHRGKYTAVEIAKRHCKIDGFTDTQVAVHIQRHAQKCVNKAAAVVMNRILEKQGVAVYEEFVDQLKFARELRDAARKWLTDPETGEIDLSPHAHEIRVHYWCERDTIESAEKAGVKIRGQRRRKIETLQVLLDKIDTERPTPYDERELVSIKSIDIRQYALNCISETDSILDKFARMGGLYKADQTNPNDVAIRAAQALALVRWGVSLANCAETKAAHAKGHNISLDFALSTLDPIRTSEEDEKVYQEMQKQLQGELA